MGSNALDAKLAAKVQAQARQLVEASATIASLRKYIQVAEERVGQLAPGHPLPLSPSCLGVLPLSPAVFDESEGGVGGKSGRRGGGGGGGGGAGKGGGRGGKHAEQVVAGKKIARLEAELKSANAKIRKLFVQRDQLKAKLAAGAPPPPLPASSSGGGSGGGVSSSGAHLAGRKISHLKAEMAALQKERDDLVENLRGEAQIAEEQRAYILVLKQMLDQKSHPIVVNAPTQSSGRSAANGGGGGGGDGGGEVDEEKEALIDFTEELLAQIDSLKSQLEDVSSGGADTTGEGVDDDDDDDATGGVDATVGGMAEQVAMDASAKLTTQIQELTTQLQKAEGQRDEALNAIETLNGPAASQIQALEAMQVELLDQLAETKDRADAAEEQAGRAGELEAILTQTEDKVVELSNALKEARAELGEAHGAAQEAELAHMKQVQEIQMAAAKEASAAEIAQARAVSRIESLESALEDAKGAVDSANASLKGALEDNQSLSSQAAEAQRELASCSARADAAEAEVVVLAPLRPALAEAQGQVESLTRNLERANAHLSELQTALGSSQAGERALQSQLASALDAVEAAEALKPRMQELMEANEALTSELATAVSTQEDVDHLCLANDALAARVENLVTQNDYLRSELSKDIGSQRAEREGLQADLDTQTARVVSQATLHGELQVVNVALREENRRLYDTVDDLSAKLRVLQAATGIEDPAGVANMGTVQTRDPAAGTSVASLQALRTENAALRLRIRQLAADLTATRNEVTDATDALAEILVSPDADPESDSARLVNLVQTLRAQIKSKSAEVEALQDEVKAAHRAGLVTGKGRLNGSGSGLKGRGSGGGEEKKGGSLPAGALSAEEAQAARMEAVNEIGMLKARVSELEGINGSLQSQLNGMTMAASSTRNEASYEREMLSNDMARLRAELGRVSDERFELEGILKGSKNEVASLRVQVERVTREKLAAEKACREANAKVRHMAAAQPAPNMITSSKGGVSSASSQYEQIDKLRSQLQESYDEFRAAQKVALEHNRERTALTVELESVKRQVSAESARATEAERAAADAAHAAAVAEDAAAVLRDEIARLTEENEVLVAQVREAQGNVRSLQASYSDADRSSASAMSATLREHAQIVSDLQGKLNRRSAEISALELQVASLQADRVELVAQISSLQHQVRAASEEAVEGSILARSLELELEGVDESVVRAQALALSSQRDLARAGQALEATMVSMGGGPASVEPASVQPMQRGEGQMMGMGGVVSDLRASNWDIQSEVGRMEYGRETSPVKTEDLETKTFGRGGDDGVDGVGGDEEANVWEKKGAGAVVYYKNVQTSEVRRDLPSNARVV